MDEQMPSVDSEHCAMVQGNGSWETLVLIAANFKKLDVHMNMGELW